MIFTDSEGRKFEQLENPVIFGGAVEVNDIVIRPIQPKPRYLITDVMDSMAPGMAVSVTVHLRMSEDQAQLIKEAISQTMRRITERRPTLIEDDLDLLDSLDDARKALMENNND